MADVDYQIVERNGVVRVQWRHAGGWFFGLWRWPWAWLSREVNCGFAGTDLEPMDFGTVVEAMNAIDADRRRRERAAVPWRLISSAPGSIPREQVGAKH